MGRTGQMAGDSGELSDSGEPSDNGRQRDGGGRPDRPGRAPADEDEGGRPAGRPIVEMHGSDVQAGPELTDEPRAGATEPPD